MKRKRFDIIMGIVFLASGFVACSEDLDLDYKGNLDLNQLVLTQARTVWNGAQCNVTVNFANSGVKASNFTYELDMSLYQEKIANTTATANLVVAADSLQRAIAKVGESSAYSIYENVELLPAEYYLLSSDKLELPAGNTHSETVELVVYTQNLISLVQNERMQDATFVLPLRIENGTSYVINEKANTLMLFFHVTYVPSKSGSEYEPDTEGVPENHELENGLVLKFHDEFNGTGVPDPEVWRFEEGFQRNQEIQWYSSGNAVCEGGALVIMGKREHVDNPNYDENSSDWKLNREYAEYTSSSIVTKNYRFRQGTMIVRAKIPVASGAWPAIWTTGGSNDSWCWEWPLGGEIDLLEYYFVNGVQSIHANACWGSNTRWSATWDSYNRPMSEFVAKDADWADKYHIWRMDWDDDYIRLYLDGELMNEIDLNNTNNGTGGLSDWWRGAWRNPFRDAGNDGEGFGQQIFLNLALGGNGGTPAISQFPLCYYVDYVRVYQRE